jgi:hypothetical protein
VSVSIPLPRPFLSWRSNASAIQILFLSSPFTFNSLHLCKLTKVFFPEEFVHASWVMHSIYNHYQFYRTSLRSKSENMAPSPVDLEDVQLFIPWFTSIRSSIPNMPKPPQNVAEAIQRLSESFKSESKVWEFSNIDEKWRGGQCRLHLSTMLNS